MTKFELVVNKVKGQPKIMKYTNCGEPESRMLQSKFHFIEIGQSVQRTVEIFQGFTIYGHGDNTGPFLRMPHMQLGFNWPSDF